MPTITKYATAATGITGTWNNTANATGSSTTTYATRTDTSTTTNRQIELSGYGFNTDIPDGSTINSVSYVIRQYVSSSSVFNNPTYGTYNGTTLVGSLVSITERTSATTDTYAVASANQPSLAVLRGDFRVRFGSNRANTNTGNTHYLGHIGVTVDYTPPGVKMETVKLSTWDGQTLFNVNASHSIVNGKLRIQCQATYPSTITTQAYDLTSSHFYADMGAIPSNSSMELELYLSVYSGTAVDDNSASIMWSGNTLIARRMVARSTNDQSIAYNPTNHRYFRIRESGGTLYWEVSGNAVTWTAIRSEATPWTATTCYGVFRSGNWGASTSTHSTDVGEVNGGSVPAAGDDQTVDPWSTVTLTGTGGSTWSQTAGAPVALTISGDTATFTAPPSMTPHVMTFSYAGDTVDVTVNRARHGVVVTGGTVEPIRLAVGKPGPAEATIRSSSTANIAYSAASNNISKPQFVNDGDLLLLFVSTDWGTATEFNPPTGFTVLFKQDKGNDLGKMMAAYKVATSSEPASYTIQANNANSEVRADLYAIAGWSGNTAELTHASTITASSATTHTAPSITPATGAGLLISAVSAENANPTAVTWAWTPPTGMTEQHDALTPNTYVSQAEATATHNTTSATGTRTWTVANMGTAQTALAGGVVVPSSITSGATFPAPYVPYEPPSVIPATVRSSATFTYNTSSTNETVVAPADTVAGDILLTYVVADVGTAAEIAPPNGFTQLAEIIPSSGPRLNVSYRVAQAGDAGASFTYPSFPSNADALGIIVCIKDWSGLTSEIAVTSGVTASSNTAHVAPDVTPLTSHGLLVSAAAMYDSNGSKSWTWTAPTGMTLTDSRTNAAGWSSGAVASQTVESNAATGTRTWTVSTTATASAGAAASVVIPSKTT